VYESLTYSSELYVSARFIFGFDVQKQTISIGKFLKRRKAPGWFFAMSVCRCRRSRVSCL